MEKKSDLLNIQNDPPLSVDVKVLQLCISTANAITFDQDADSSFFHMFRNNWRTLEEVYSYIPKNQQEKREERVLGEGLQVTTSYRETVT